MTQYHTEEASILFLSSLNSNWGVFSLFPSERRGAGRRSEGGRRGRKKLFNCPSLSFQVNRKKEKEKSVVASRKSAWDLEKKEIACKRKVEREGEGREGISCTANKGRKVTGPRIASRSVPPDLFLCPLLSISPFYFECLSHLRPHALCDPDTLMAIN